jgi:uncharacterized protein YcfJ
MSHRTTSCILCVGLALSSLGARAQQMMAQVISVEPVTRQVAVAEWACAGQANQRQDQPSWGYAAGGAAAGGLLGSQVGKGRGRDVAIAAGAAAGALAAESYARSQHDPSSKSDRCAYVTAHRRAPTGAYRALVDVDGAPYEFMTRQALSPGELVPVDMRALRSAQ